MATNITDPQKKLLIKLLNQHGLMEARVEYIEALTDGRTGSLRELTKSEANLFIQQLNKGSSTASSDRMRKKILSLAYQLGWVTAKGQVDLPRVNNWCQQRGAFKKPLNHHTYKELVHLVSQFQQMYFKQYR